MTYRNNEKEYFNFQLAKLSGRSQFMEITSRSFEIDKVLFSFQNYDSKKQTGSKITLKVDVYMDFGKFFAFAKGIEDKSILADAYASYIAKERGVTQYDNGVMVAQGGTKAENMKVRRPDGKGEARIFSIRTATKKGDDGKHGILLHASVGPGKPFGTGLIKMDGRPDGYVQVMTQYKDLLEAVLITKEHIRAYLASKYVYVNYKELSKGPAARSDQQQSQPQQNYQQPAQGQQNYQQPQQQTQYQQPTPQQGQQGYRQYQPPVQQPQYQQQGYQAPYPAQDDVVQIIPNRQG